MNKKENIIICRCEEVTEKEVEDAIEDGADTLDSIKRFTRAGMGLCQRRTCQLLVARIVSEKTGKPLEKIYPATSRPPVRPIALDIMAKEGERILAKGQK